MVTESMLALKRVVLLVARLGMLMLLFEGMTRGADGIPDWSTATTVGMTSVLLGGQLEAPSTGLPADAQKRTGEVQTGDGRTGEGRTGETRAIDIREFGAVGDGEALCTEAIQKAIDTCSAQGGGTVCVSKGRWRTGTVYLADRVTLLLRKDAVLLGSRNPVDYALPRTVRDERGHAKTIRIGAILAGENLNHIRIIGKGTIDGQGDAFRDKTQVRPKAIHLIGCRDVVVETLHLRNAGSWMQHYRLCEDVRIHGIDVFNHASFNNDGLNIDSCGNVEIADCRIDSDDDGIVLKSLSLTPCRNVTVANCVVSSHCNALKMGTESGGGFQKIRIRDCRVHSPERSKVIYGRQRGLAGIALEIVDGGEMSDVRVEGIRIDGVSVPVFVRLGNRARVYESGQSKPSIGSLHDVVIRDVIARNTGDIGCSITGLPGHPVRNITLENLDLEFDGGGTKDLVERTIPEKAESYPESIMFGQLPSWGFFCRHVEGLTFDGLKLATKKGDLRSVLYLEDVGNISLRNFQAVQWPNAASQIEMRDVRDAVGLGDR